MEEAQKELEKNATPNQKTVEEEDEDDDDIGAAIGVRSGPAGSTRDVQRSDRDLLDGADAVAGASGDNGQSLLDADPSQGRVRAGSAATTASTGVVEFEG